MKLIALSDVHGNVRRCRDVANKNPDRIIIQIGDLGVGFMPREIIESLPSNFYFFCGNHDNRTEANSLRNCIGDFGEMNGFFFVSGADSIDKEDRIENVNWWANEELNYEQASQCLEKWEKSKCQILLSHDLPQRAMEAAFGYKEKCLTRNLLQSMIDARKPSMIIYGHHHKHKRFRGEGIEYVGLGIDETYDFEC